MDKQNQDEFQSKVTERPVKQPTTEANVTQTVLTAVVSQTDTKVPVKQPIPKTHITQAIATGVQTTVGRTIPSVQACDIKRKPKKTKRPSNTHKAQIYIYSGNGWTQQQLPEEKVLKQPATRNWIWDYFTPVSAMLAQCKLCTRNICHGEKVIRNTHRHMKKTHKEIYDKYMQENGFTMNDPETSTIHTEGDTQTRPQIIPQPATYTPTGTFTSAQKQRQFPAGIPKSFLLREYMQQERGFTVHGSETSTIHTQGNTQMPTPPQIIPQPTKNSPTEGFSVNDKNNEKKELESPNLLEANESRVSAFERLGPISQPKRPKLTINLLFSKDQPVREVVDGTKQKKDNPDSEAYTPVHKRRELSLSIDELVIKYLPLWPWRRSPAVVDCSPIATPRRNKEAMMRDLAALTEIYSQPDIWIHVEVEGYPIHFTKENVLDTMFDNLKNYIFIPCFIEFNPKLCKFLVIKSIKALTALHNMGLICRNDNNILSVTLARSGFKLNNLEFHPRLVISRRLALAYSSFKNKLNLSYFCLQPDISYFIYFPLNRLINQYELMDLQTSISWKTLRELDLSHNRLTSIEGFKLYENAPNLRVLDLSHNYLEKLTDLMEYRGMPLHSLKLEGNPLCTDFTDPDAYIKIARTLFPCLKYLDGVPLLRSGDIPKILQNYCIEAAKELIDKFLRIYFPLLETEPHERVAIEEMYDKQAMWSLTYHSRMRLDTPYSCKDLFSRYRNLSDDITDHIIGNKEIARHLTTWPALLHDYYTFTVDMLHHSDTTTIITLSGVMKILADSLADDEPIVGFTRTLVLNSENEVRYKILNEMVTWYIPTKEIAQAAFRIASVHPKQLVSSLKLDHPPDDELKEKLLDIFMEVTTLDKSQSKMCLEIENWNFKEALEHLMRILKLKQTNKLKQTI